MDGPDQPRRRAAAIVGDVMDLAGALAGAWLLADILSHGRLNAWAADRLRPARAWCSRALAARRAEQEARQAAREVVFEAMTYVDGGGI